jgi:hypothetical protein
MVILIVGSPHDKTIRHTIDRARRRGVPYRYFDILRFLRKGSYSWDFRARSGQLRCGGERLDLPDPAISALYLRLVDIAERVPVEERDGVRVRMRVLVQALRGVETMVVNRPGRDMSNWAKGYHQQLLAQCGFTVPRTLVTNEEAAARAFLAEVPSVVFKGARAGSRRSHRNSRPTGIRGSVCSRQVRCFFRSELLGLMFVRT